MSQQPVHHPDPAVQLTQTEAALLDMFADFLRERARAWTITLDPILMRRATFHHATRPRSVRPRSVRPRTVRPRTVRPRSRCNHNLIT